ncbi:alpha/beta fold hydrolase [Sphingobium sufflavum]|uniref:alpha/beta fold hydrolase n=1 Tax=Sphingobium sufflavum TaxID=1129547 RepID=UPI001F3BEC40|nr:alpha/beta hydrolase [Sphingobium sufflavum]
MATFVLVHGGGHGGWCYQPVARLLARQGHDVYAPTLTGLGERSHLLRPDIDLDFHINDVVQLLHYEDLRDVILVGHSYGGMVITGVADRAPDRVGHRVYLDAAYPNDGDALAEIAPMVGEARRQSRIVDGIELFLFPDSEHHFYGVQDPAVQAWMAPRLTPHPWACFEQKLVFRNEAVMRAIPESHIICSITKPGRDMEAMHARSDGRVWDVDTGHDLMLSEPDWVADKLEKVAASMG